MVTPVHIDDPKTSVVRYIESARVVARHRQCGSTHVISCWPRGQIERWGRTMAGSEKEQYRAAHKGTGCCSQSHNMNAKRNSNPSCALYVKTSDEQVNTFCSKPATEQPASTLCLSHAAPLTSWLPPQYNTAVIRCWDASPVRYRRQQPCSSESTPQLGTLAGSSSRTTSFGGVAASSA